MRPAATSSDSGTSHTYGQQIHIRTATLAEFFRHLDRSVRAVVALPREYWEHNLIEGGVRVLTHQGTPLPCQIEPAPHGRILATLVLGSRESLPG